MATFLQNGLSQVGRGQPSPVEGLYVRSVSKLLESGLMLAPDMWPCSNRDLGHWSYLGDIEPPTELAEKC